MLIEAENVSRLYGSGSSQVAALQEVSLTIRPGDFLSIMGPSGSGKSTLLHLLSGLDRPTSGRLLYDGQDIYGLRDRELSAFRRSRIGFIFQQFHLCLYRLYLCLPRRLQGFKILLCPQQFPLQLPVIFLIPAFRPIQFFGSFLHRSSGGPQFPVP